MTRAFTARELVLGGDGDGIVANAELLAAHDAGLTLVEYRKRVAGGKRVEPDTDDEQRLEKAEGHEVDKVLRAFGGRVYNLSQSRASKQTPGLPDRWVFFQRVAWAGWFEVKRQVGGRLSSAQELFLDLCEATGTHYTVGGRKEAEELVISLGLAYRDDASGALEPVRRG